VDLSGIDRNVVIKQSCNVYNKYGQLMITLSKNLNIEVAIEVAKEIPIRPVLNGSPANGYFKGNESIYPQSVLISGPRNILEKISELKTLPININNISKSLNITAKVDVPNGLSLVNASKDVNVIVTIIPLAKKEFNVTNSEIILSNAIVDNSLNYVIQTKQVKITLQGSDDDLKNISLETLRPTINVTGLGEGTFKLPLVMNLPVNVKAVQKYYIDVTIQKVVSTQNR
jgi:YbbR domain-containing protein